MINTISWLTIFGISLAISEIKSWKSSTSKFENKISETTFHGIAGIMFGNFISEIIFRKFLFLRMYQAQFLNSNFRNQISEIKFSGVSSALEMISDGVSFLFSHGLSQFTSENRSLHLSRLTILLIMFFIFYRSMALVTASSRLELSTNWISRYSSSFSLLLPITGIGIYSEQLRQFDRPFHMSSWIFIPINEDYFLK